MFFFTVSPGSLFLQQIGDGNLSLWVIGGCIIPKQIFALLWQQKVWLLQCCTWVLFVSPETWWFMVAPFWLSGIFLKASWFLLDLTDAADTHHTVVPHLPPCRYDMTKTTPFCPDSMLCLLKWFLAFYPTIITATLATYLIVPWPWLWFRCANQNN